MKKIFNLIVVCCLLLISTTQFVNGYSADISLPYSVQGRFTTSSSLTSEGNYKDTYCFYGTAGQTIQVSMDSNDFDSYIIILDTSAKRVAEDDDGGSGTNSYLEYKLTSSGRYSIVATQFRNRTGSYTININSLDSSGGSSGNIDSGDDFSSSETIRINNKCTNIYSSLDHEWDEDYYLFQAPVEGRYVIETVSGGTNIDTYGYLRYGDHSLLTVDNDSGSGTNFQMTEYLNAGSWYYIIVAGHYEDDIGNYNLRIEAPVNEIVVPGSNETVCVTTVFERGFSPNISGFYSSNNLYYMMPDKKEQGVCFGMCSVAALNNSGKLPKTGPVIESGFGYNISGIDAFISGSLYQMTSNSIYNIGTLPRDFEPAMVTIDSSAVRRIGQAVGWYQYYQEQIKRYDPKASSGISKEVWSWEKLNTISELTNKINNSRPFVVLAQGNINHSMLPTGLYKVINQNKYLLGVYDPDYPAQTNYIELITDNDIITNYNVLRWNTNGSSSDNYLRFIDLTNFADSIMN